MYHMHVYCFISGIQEMRALWLSGWPAVDLTLQCKNPCNTWNANFGGNRIDQYKNFHHNHMEDKVDEIYNIFSGAEYDFFVLLWCIRYSINYLNMHFSYTCAYSVFLDYNVIFCWKGEQHHYYMFELLRFTYMFDLTLLSMSEVKSQHIIIKVIK